MHEKRCVVKSGNANSTATVEYLKIFNDNTLITSPSKEFTCIAHIDNDIKYYPIPILTKFCAMVFDNYLLVVNDYGTSVVSKNNFLYLFTDSLNK